ncbi:hypothetical protein DC3_41040 [Deinococcus cellulosilyticus NBRC 106333 = KACC 11606]|uniref:Tyrosine--tRNA ligase n=2 Tax=Deinococcus cellulosilyticus TaxID=401558 RepID=A0A511N6G7_DEIC1|nr:hypothetical protein DC3_41040 [Deinococcus cellulosilyticus NBRC 106333 = KACC 11606]
MIPAQQQIEILKRGAVDLISEEDLKRKIETGKQLRVKLGADPTRPDLHLGHAVILKKMRQFQELGHKVIMLIGDFTAMIGDPSGKSKTRPPLTLEETRQNAHSYLEQCKLILKDDPEVLELRYNSEWLEPLGYADVIRLASRYTVARILERDDFTKRLQSGTPISLHELLYPLTQGYDSVALEADVELGGTDQLFNNLVGRTLQGQYEQEPQVVLTLPLLVGLDGVEKMSKSLNNYIGLTDTPDVMFAKLMKVPDNLLENYFTLLTDLSINTIENILTLHPIRSHRILATLVVAWIHGKYDITDESTLVTLLRYDDFTAIFDIAKAGNTGKFLKGLRDLYELLPGLRFILTHNTNNLPSQTVQSIKNLCDQIQELPNLIDELSRMEFTDINEKQRYHNIIIKFHNNFDIFREMLIKETNSIIELALKNKDTAIFKDWLEIQSKFEVAKERYEQIAKGGIPDDLQTTTVPEADFNEAGKVGILKLIVLGGLATSNKEARRFVEQKGIKLNGETFTDPQAFLDLSEPVVLQRGKDRFARLSR